MHLLLRGTENCIETLSFAFFSRLVKETLNEKVCEELSSSSVFIALNLTS